MSPPFIPVTKVVIDEAIRESVLRVLDSGQLAQGPVVARLEDGFRALCGVEHAVAVSSGTTALVASLQALGVGPGDEVVTSPFTFAATLNAVLECGATVRFADIDPVDFTIDAVALEAVVSDRTRVVMPVHLYGQPAAMDRVVAVAGSVGARVVEDAAQAHGARFASRPVGSFDVGCFSLYATKNIQAGEGGVVTTDDADVADRLRVLRNQGMRARYEYVMAGHNYRMTDLQAAVAVPQLETLPAITEARRTNAAQLTELIEGIVGITTPVVRDDRDHVFHQYTIRVGPDAGLSRDTLAEALHAEGIGTGVYYPRVVHDYDCYRNHPLVPDPPESVPAALRAAAEVLSLPVHASLGEGDVERIGAAVGRCVTTASRG